MSKLFSILDCRVWIVLAFGLLFSTETLEQIHSLNPEYANFNLLADQEIDPHSSDPSQSKVLSDCMSPILDQNLGSTLLKGEGQK